MNLDPGLELRKALGLNGVLPLLADRGGGKLVLVLERKNTFKLQTCKNKTDLPRRTCMGLGLIACGGGASRIFVNSALATGSRASQPWRLL